MDTCCFPPMNLHQENADQYLSKRFLSGSSLYWATDHTIRQQCPKMVANLKKDISIDMSLVTMTDTHFNPKMHTNMHSHSLANPKNTFISHKYAHSHRSVFMYSKWEPFQRGEENSLLLPAVLTVGAWASNGKSLNLPLLIRKTWDCLILPHTFPSAVKWKQTEIAKILQGYYHYII